MAIPADEKLIPDPALSLTAMAPLRTPVFRMLWSAWLVANICMWMNDVAAAWLMTSLTTSPVMVALVQSASTLPMFLLGLPSGAMADIVNRRYYLMFTQFWVAVVAVLLCVTVLSDGMSPPVLLMLTFANGIGLAMRLPVFAAIVPDLVPRPQLPAALALNGVAMNASRIIGPVLAGALLASAGAQYVFVLNAVLSVVTGFIVMRWKHVPKVSALPGERFLGAIRVGVQYVRQSVRMRTVLTRVVAFFLQSTALVALMPLIPRAILKLEGAGAYTLLLASMGLGAVGAAFLLPRLRRTMSLDDIVLKASLVQGAATLVVAFAPNVYVAAPAMMIAGTAWLSVANTLSVSSQLALPDWVRARGMSIFQMGVMGSSAFGAALWGQVASISSVRISLTAAALGGAALLFLLRNFKLDDSAEEDLTPSQAWTAPVSATPIDANAGPVMVTIEYFVEESRRIEFMAVMQESRRSRLRHGALSWELFHDTSDPTRFLEYYIDESWVEHLRRFDRFTASDESLRDRRSAFHTGDKPPLVSRFIAEQLPNNS